MSSQTRTVSSGSLTILFITGMGLLAQVIVSLTIWQHTSDNGAILGQYSLSYLPFLVLGIAGPVLWLFLFFRRDRVYHWLAQ